MQIASKTNGQNANITQNGDGIAVPDFFASFLETLIANDSLNANNNSDMSVANSLLSDDSQNSKTDNDEIKSSELISLPLSLFQILADPIPAKTDNSDLAAIDGEIQKPNQIIPLLIDGKTPIDAAKTESAVDLQLEQTDFVAHETEKSSSNSLEKIFDPNQTNSEIDLEAILAKSPEAPEAKNLNDQSKIAETANKPGAKPFEAKRMDADRGDGNQIIAAIDGSDKINKADLMGPRPLDTESSPLPKAKSEQTFQFLKSANSHNHLHVLDFNQTLNNLQDTTSVKAGNDVNGQTVASRVTEVAQIMVEKAQNGEKSFFVRLDPPELGKIEVELKFGENNKIEAVLKAQTPEALNELMRQARDMVDTLNQSGFNLSRNDLNFSLNHSNNGNANQNNSTKHAKARKTDALSENLEVETKATIATQKWNRTGISLVA